MERAHLVQIVVALVIAGAATAFGLSARGQALVTEVVVGALEHTSPEAPARLAPNLFAVARERYLVNFWCTPAALVVCVSFLLGIGLRAPSPFLRALVPCAAFASVAVPANIVLSVLLHQRLGWAWRAVHLPGLVLVYALCLALAIACLRPARVVPATKPFDVTAL